MKKISKIIEKDGKPCSLNLITEKDIQFLKKLAKKNKLKEQEKFSDVDQTNENIDESEEEVDELTAAIKREELELERRVIEEKENQRLAKLQVLSIK